MGSQGEFAPQIVLIFRPKVVISVWSVVFWRKTLKTRLQEVVIEEKTPFLFPQEIGFHNIQGHTTPNELKVENFGEAGLLSGYHQIGENCQDRFMEMELGKEPVSRSKEVRDRSV